MTSSTNKKKLIQGTGWATLAQKLHRKARSYYRHKTWRNRKLLAKTLHDIKTMQLYKDLGYATWKDYVYEAWSTGRVTVDHWARTHKLFEAIPDALKLAPPGFVGIRRLALLSGFVTDREDLLWWANLCRVTSWGEFNAIVRAAREAARCGHPAESTYLYVGWVDETTQRRVVSAAFNAARKDLGATASVGDCIAWACARAIDKNLPRSVGSHRTPVRGHKTRPVRHPVTVGGPKRGAAQ
jgi:hypothetical protein